MFLDIPESLKIKKYFDSTEKKFYLYYKLKKNEKTITNLIISFNN